MIDTGGDVRMLTGTRYRLFFERNLQDVLERHEAASQVATSELRQLLDLSGEHVRALRLQQFPSHLELAVILDGLPRLEELQLSCGQQDLQMSYDRALFGLPAARCRALSQCLGRLHGLTHLDLSMNLLDDAKIDMLAEGLNKTTAIRSLVLHSNKIQADGALAMGRALQKEECRLTSLNMRLNEVGEEGGHALAVALQNNKSLKHLDIGANNIGPTACTAFAGVLQSNSTLQELDLSCNPLAPGKGGWLLHEAIKANQRVVQLDVRCSEIEDECQKAIAAVIVKRQMSLHAL
ncbi:g2749 [Coccomyxa elongata]